VKNADIVILAIPISGHADSAAMIRGHLNPRTVVIDVSNTSFSRAEALKHAQQMESNLAALQSSTPSIITSSKHHHKTKTHRKSKKDRRKLDLKPSRSASHSSERSSLLGSSGALWKSQTSYMSINGDDSPITIDTEVSGTDIVESFTLVSASPTTTVSPLMPTIDATSRHENDYEHKLHCRDPCCDPSAESPLLAVPRSFMTIHQSEVAGNVTNNGLPTRRSVSDIENLHKHPRVAKLGQPEESGLGRLNLMESSEGCEGCDKVEGGVCKSDVKVRCPAPGPWNRNCANMSNAEHLQRLLPGIAVVKAFNTVSAYALQAGPGAVQEDRVLVCGDSQEAKDKVFTLIWAMGMRPVDVGPLVSARDTERKSVTLFDDWRAACWTSGILFVLAATYIFVRDIVFNPYGFYPADLFLLKFNVIVAWHALALFTATFAAGIVAALRQLTTGTAKRKFPKFLEVWLNSRKALGLQALASAFVHMIAATITDHLFVNFAFVRSTEGTFYQASIFAALLSILIYGALVATSIPSVAANLSWREWNFVQSKMGIVGLFFGTAHAGLMAFALGDLPNARAWPYYLAPASIIITALASVVLIMRAIIAFPPIANRLDRIRSGG
jgi:predicted dinucleotide-binding enzyme/DMSO/TMAO reductase YedYZ heme-binding membrane subunit